VFRGLKKPSPVPRGKCNLGTGNVTTGRVSFKSRLRLQEKKPWWTVLIEDGIQQIEDCRRFEWYWRFSVKNRLPGNPCEYYAIPDSESLCTLLFVDQLMIWSTDCRPSVFGPLKDLSLAQLLLQLRLNRVRTRNADHVHVLTIRRGVTRSNSTETESIVIHNLSAEKLFHVPLDECYVLFRCSSHGRYLWKN